MGKNWKFLFCSILSISTCLMYLDALLIYLLCKQEELFKIFFIFFVFFHFYVCTFTVIKIFYVVYINNLLKIISFCALFSGKLSRNKVSFFVFIGFCRI